MPIIRMNVRKRKKEERPIFDSIRKPTAPAGHRMGQDKPDEKAHPSRRKAKHKKNIERELNGDI